MAVQIPAQAIADAKLGAGDQWMVCLAIAGPESSWTADAKGDYKTRLGGPIVPKTTPGAFPTSFGYLQYHVDGGLGQGHKISDLLNGVYNMRQGGNYIRARLAAGTNVYGAMQPWTTRPAAYRLYERIRAEGIEPVGTATFKADAVLGGGVLLLVAVAVLLIMD